MEKLTEISSGKNNKSCGIFHRESNKIGFAFFLLFSTIFYAIYKKRPKNFYYLSYQLQGGPQKETFLCNVAPGTAGRCGRLDSGDRWRRDWSGTGGEGLWVARVRFGRSVGGEKPPVGGAPAAGCGGRRGPCCGAVEPRRGWPGRDKGRRGGGTRARRDDRPPFKQSSRTGRQRTNRRSPGCAVHGTVSQGSYAAGTTPDGSGRVSPRGVRPRGARPRGGWPRAVRSP
jgi:hypothetical protein